MNQNNQHANGAETMGFYQDERSDSVNADAFRIMTWVYVIELFGMGIYQLTQTAWLGAVLVVLGLGMSGWFTWQHYNLGNDEFAQHQLGKQYRASGTGLIISTLFGFVLANMFTTPGVEWLILMIIPSVFAIVIQLSKKILPPRAWIVIASALVLPAIYAFLATTGALSNSIWLVSIAAALVILAILIYFTRK